MDLKQATVTIPYEEFKKHQEEVAEIAKARDVLKKMEKGDLFDRSIVQDLKTQRDIYQEYVEELETSRFSSKVPKTLGQIASDRGYQASLQGSKYILKLRC